MPAPEVLGETGKHQCCVCRCQVPAELGGHWAGSWSQAPAETGSMYMKLLWVGSNTVTTQVSSFPRFLCWGRIARECNLVGLLRAATHAVGYVPGKPQLSPQRVSHPELLAPGRSFRPSSLDLESTVPPHDLGLGLGSTCSTSLLSHCKGKEERAFNYWLFFIWRPFLASVLVASWDICVFS